MYYVPGAVLGAQGVSVNKTKIPPTLTELTS